MITETQSVIMIGLFFINLIVIWTIKDKAYRKGYKKAELDVTHNMLNVATWFGSNKTEIYNTLYLFAKKYRYSGNVSAEYFRADIFSLKDERITDIPVKDEFKRYVE